MTRVTYFLYTEGFVVEEEKDKKRLQLISPQLLLRPPYVPGAFSFSISFAVQGLDTSLDNTVQLIFRGPEKQEILKTDKIQIQSINEQEAKLPIEFRGFQMNMDLRNVELRAEGEYVSEVYFNDNLLGEFPINVKSGDAK